MKNFPLVTAVLSVSALGLGNLSAVHAQDAPATPAPMMQDKPMVQTNPTSGKPMMMVPATASAGDLYKAQWAFRNLDEREVKRYKTAGFSDATIRGAGNIALRAGIPVEYVLRRVREVGEPLASIAASYGLSTKQVDAEIPGYGLETMSIVGGPSTTMSAPMMHSGMTTTTTDTTMAMNTSNSMPPVPSSVPALASAQGTVVDVAMGNPDFTTLVTALKAADLVDMLKGPGPFTIFAPTNAAFAKLPAGAVDDLLKPENKEKLRSVLQYHVVPGKIMAADVMAMTNPSTPRTASGATLNVKTTAPVMVNDANVTATDIVASNGVIHVIDTVLMPPAP